ncbi:MAG: YceI family protein [Bacteroidota bacterium]|nr:YceI family protein [Bacteroidota bacterium]
MKSKLLILLMLGSFQLMSAQKYISKSGHIWFISNTPMEVIEGHNRQAVSTLDVSTGDVAFMMLIKAFEFKIALMQEHFNENYMESDKIPKSSFKGKITNIGKIDFKKDGSYAAEVSGDLTIHGVTKAVSTKGTIEVKGKVITTKAKFTVSPKDYGIKIPSLVESKVAKEVEINVDTPYNSN